MYGDLEKMEFCDMCDRLHASGWLSTEADTMVNWYGITQEEAAEICDRLQEIEDAEQEA